MMTNVPENSLMLDTAGDDLIDASHALNGNGQRASGEMERATHFQSAPFLSLSMFDAWHKYARRVVERVSPAVRRSTEAWIGLGQENCRLAAKLLSPAVERDNAGSVADVAGRVSKAWQEAVGAFQETISAAADANAQIVGLWSEAIVATLPQGAAEEPSGAAGTIVLPLAAHSAGTHEEIQRLAYELWERKGRRHGMDWEDWFEAEAALTQGRRLAA